MVFVENKNTHRPMRNANNGKEQVFVTNKDTNREAKTPADAADAAGVVPIAVVPPRTNNGLNCRVPEGPQSGLSEPSAVSFFFFFLERTNKIERLERWELV